jgi:hypothetical protein
MSGISRRTIITAGVAVVSGALLPRRAKAQEFRYKLGLELRPGEPLAKRMMDACKAIANETNGRLQIQGFPNGQLVLLCHKKFEVVQQYGHLFNCLEMWAAIRQRNVAIESGTCRCIRWGAAWDVVRG